MKLDNIKSYVIHLRKRTDRYKLFTKELRGFKKDYEIFNAIRKTQGCWGTSESFKSIIKKCKKEGYKQVLIFEDDVKFCSPKSKEKFQKAIDDLPKDWDILLGGVYSLGNKNELKKGVVTDNLVKVTDFSSLHCTLINHTAYDYFLKHDYNKGMKHIDRFLGRESKKGNISVYLTYPMVAIQHEGYSDNVKGNVNYKNLLKNFELLK